jgi:exodeoxyribonuclease VII large subunit
MTFKQPEETPRTAEVISVSMLNRLARETLEHGFPLLWVSGEVSNLARAASGHIYFSLKDEAAQVRCVMFRNRAQIVPFRLQEGMRIEARALVTLYEARGDFQLNVEALRQAGIGALYEAFARLREKLEKEGLFAEERRKPLPRFPRRIGIVTSLQAAALSDILAALKRRCPHLPVVIYPAPVQGEGAAEKIAAAIQTAGKRGECDVLIVARGGGGIEDLWSFNEESVARAIDHCPIPVVTGVGHETDTTIADLVADRRAATPTAAAELASAGFFEAGQHLAKLGSTLRDAMRRALETRMQRLDLLGRSLVHPGERLARLRAEVAHLGTRIAGSLRLRLGRSAAELQQARARLAAARPDMRHAKRDLHELGGRMQNIMAARFEEQRIALDALATNLAHLSPDAVLQRGYSITRKADGSIVRSSEQLAEDEVLRLTFGHGWAGARVTDRGDA